jgi:hypothetical protein
MLMDNIQTIHERNTRVEADKAWETSWTRRGLIALMTYIILAGYLSFLQVEGAWKHAVVPTAGYLLSTLTLGVLKKFWIEKVYTP